MQENNWAPLRLEVGPATISWRLGTKFGEIICEIHYNEEGFAPGRLLASGRALCSEEDAAKNLCRVEKGMQISLKRALLTGELLRPFRRKVWFAFRNKIGWPKPPYKPTQKETKLPKDLIGQSFHYKGENYTVVNIVWGKAPRAKNPPRDYWKKGEKPGKRMWVEYVEYEPHRGMEQRFVRPKAEFLSKFRLVENLETNVRVIEDMPDNALPAPSSSAFDNFE